MYLLRCICIAAAIDRLSMLRELKMLVFIAATSDSLRVPLSQFCPRNCWCASFYAFSLCSTTLSMLEVRKTGAKQTTHQPKKKVVYDYHGIQQRRHNRSKSYYSANDDTQPIKEKNENRNDLFGPGGAAVIPLYIFLCRV